MMNFPDNPVVGQVYNPQTGNVYTWDGVAWNLAPIQVKTANRKNRIVNPCFVISMDYGQSVLTVTGAYPADQWQESFQPAGAVNFAQVAVASPEGSNFRVRTTVLVAKGALAATDNWTLSQKIEGARVREFLFGAANARQVVMRFGVRGPAGTYGLSIRNAAFDRCFLANFTISAVQANIDTVQTIVIPGDIIGTWARDGTTGLNIGITFAVGSTFIGVAGWQSGSFLAAAGISNGLATVGNTFDLFDVGLYCDPDKTGIAPPFEVPDYEDDVFECCRYNQECMVSIQAPSAGFAIVPWYLAVEMRTTPTLVVIAPGNASSVSGPSDGPTDTKGGYFQVQITGGSGSLTHRKYRLTSRM